MTPAWTPLSSTPRYSRGRLTFREDAWRLPDGREMVDPVPAVGVTVGVLAFVDEGHAAPCRARSRRRPPSASSARKAAATPPPTSQPTRCRPTRTSSSKVTILRYALSVRSR